MYIFIWANSTAFSHENAISHSCTLRSKVQQLIQNFYCMLCFLLNNILVRQIRNCGIDMKIDIYYFSNVIIFHFCREFIDKYAIQISRLILTEIIIKQLYYNNCFILICTINYGKRKETIYHIMKPLTTFCGE